MKKFLYLLVLVLFSTKIGAQILIDTVHQLQNWQTASLLTYNDTIEWFTYSRNGIGGNITSYRTLRFDTNNVLIGNIPLPLASPGNRQVRKEYIQPDYHIFEFNLDHLYMRFSNSTSASSFGTVNWDFPISNKWKFIDIKRAGEDEIVVFLSRDTSFWQGTVVSLPVIVRYTPSTYSAQVYELSQRDSIYYYDVKITDVKAISNNLRIVSCYGCKLVNMNGFGHYVNTGHSDLALYNRDFQFLKDTVPYYDPNFTFDVPFTGFTGPISIQSLIKTPQADIVFLGSLYENFPFTMDKDLMLAKWSPQLQKIDQVRFGSMTSNDYLNDGSAFVLGLDGFFYTFTNRYNASNRLSIVVSKFDYYLNFISESLIQHSFDLNLNRVVACRSGVYFVATVDQVSSGNPTFLYRIRNSGVGVGVKRGEQLVAARVYPNPVQELLYWEAEQETQRFVWYDMQGRKLREEQFTAAQRQELNTETLAPGIYLLQAFTPDGRNFAPQRVVVR